MATAIDNTNLDEAYLKIAQEAAFIANRDPWVIENFPKAQSIYQPGDNLHYKLGLKLPPDVVSLETTSQDVIDKLHEIGVQSMKRSIKVNERLFVGLILGHARKGKNYFELNA